MKICPVCNNSIPDDAVFCDNCGANTTVQPGAYAVPPQQPYMPNFAPSYDHTAEFDAKDISDNKVIAMLAYLLGLVGVVIALLGAKDSPYVAFHVRQALKFTIVNTLLGIGAYLLCWTIIAPIAAAVLMLVLLVIRFVCFFQVAGNQAKEPAIIRGFDFLK